MRHDDNCLSLLVQVAEDLHNLETGLAVEVPGRFIAEKDLRIIDQCPGNGDTLLLSPGKLVGTVGAHIRIDAHCTEVVGRPSCRVPLFVLENERVLHVLECGKEGDQVKFLEDIPDDIPRIWVRSRLDIFATFSPAIKSSPDVGTSRMPSWFIIVDLPEPDGPMIATNSPSADIKRYMIERCKVTTLQMVCLRDFRQPYKGQIVHVQTPGHCFLNFARIHFLFT